jgi:hypothetical protein
MDRIDLLVYRIIRGVDIFTYEGISIEYKPPSLKLLHEAELLYLDIIENNKFGDFILEEQAQRDIILSGLATQEDKDEFDGMEKRLTNARKELYEQYRDKNLMGEKIKRKLIVALNERYAKLWKIFHLLDNIVLELYARDEAEMYIAEKSIKIGGFPKYRISRDVFNIIKNRFITAEEYRRVARNNLWLSYYYNDFFKSKELNREQANAISVTRTYQNAMSHHEPPSEEVIEDYDLFQGWIAWIKESSEIKKKKQEIDKKAEGKSGASFVLVENEEEAQKVQKMNTPQSNAIAKSLLSRGKKRAKTK